MRRRFFVLAIVSALAFGILPAGAVAAAPAFRGRLKTTTSVHTVKCIDATCTYAYSAGAYDKGKFSIFDLGTART